MSLRTRYITVTAGLVFLVALAISVGAYSIATNQLENQVTQSLNNRASQVLKAFDNPRFNFDDVFGRGPLNRALVEPETDSITQLVSGDGTIIKRVDYPTLPVTQEDLAMSEGSRRTYYSTISVEGREFRMLTIAAPGGGLIQVAKGTQILVDAQQGMRIWFPLFATVAVLIAAAAGWLFARRISRPIETLAATAESIAVTKNLDSSIDVVGTDEVAQLGRSFNTMLTALRESTDRQRRLVQDASHELRTPLTSLRANAELLERAVLSDDDRAAILKDMKAEVDELTALSQELSALATDQRSSESPQEIDLADVAIEIADRAMRRTQTSITVHTTADTIIIARPSQLDRALSNLIDNAVKFNDGNAPIEVHVGARRVEVRDHGPGIPDSDKPHVFERFYRATSTRSMPGSGLGLAIVAQFAEDHDATAYVLDNVGGGAIVGIQFPVVA
jgi:two-component system sensor histidine kinase MprB